MTGVEIAAIGSAIFRGVGSVANLIAGNDARRANRRSARRAARMNSAELTRRGVQESIATAAEARALRDAAVRNRSTIAASLAAGGLTGNTAEALDAEVVFDADAATDVLERSLAWNLDSLNYQKVAEYAQMQSRIAQTPRPSYVALGLDLANNAMESYDWYKRATFAPEARTPTPLTPITTPAPQAPLPGLPLMGHPV